MEKISRATGKAYRKMLPTSQVLEAKYGDLTWKLPVCNYCVHVALETS